MSVPEQKLLKNLFNHHSFRFNHAFKYGWQSRNVAVYSQITMRIMQKSWMPDPNRELSIMGYWGGRNTSPWTFFQPDSSIVSSYNNRKKKAMRQHSIRDEYQKASDQSVILQCHLLCCSWQCPSSASWWWSCSGCLQTNTYLDAIAKCKSHMRMKMKISHTWQKEHHDHGVDDGEPVDLHVTHGEVRVPARRPFHFTLLQRRREQLFINQTRRADFLMEAATRLTSQRTE